MVVSVWMISAPSTRAAEGEPAAGQRGAADDDGEDRVELDPQAGVVAVGAVTFELIISPAMPGAERRRTRTTSDDQAARPDAGQAARLGVAADRLDEHAERGAAGEQPR